MSKDRKIQNYIGYTDYLYLAVTPDLHGYLPEIKEPFDLMLICGDICPVDLPHTKYVQEDWLFGKFIDWVKALPFSDTFAQVVMCAGNHGNDRDRKDYDLQVP